jgi:hypothetical protein
MRAAALQREIDQNGFPAPSGLFVLHRHRVAVRLRR